MSPKATALLACTVFPAVLGLAACNALSPTEPKAEKAAASQCEAGPYLIHLSGQCRVASSRRIVCEDESATTPKEKVLNVMFQLRSAASGTPMETKSIDPGALPREASFSGLAPGGYEIRHTVQARDCTATFTTYAGLDVF
jgi:hypothetical protein